VNQRPDPVLRLPGDGRVALAGEASASPASRFAPGSDSAQEYADWVLRIRNTYVSVVHCCKYRLPEHPDGPARVGLDVIAGLLERPRVFQFFGLPFSGRVGHIAERSISAVANGADASAAIGFAEVEQRLLDTTAEHQEVIVYAWVDGHEGEALAEALHLDLVVAEQRRNAALAHLKTIVLEARRPVAGAERRVSDAAGLD
jgi:hypothetical protein